MVKKKNSNKWVLPVSIVGGLILLIIIISAVSNNSNDFSQYGNNDSKIESCKDVQVPYDYLEEYQETIPYTDTECESKVLTYSITNFVFVSSVCNSQVEECNKYFLGVCTDKTVYCTDRTILCSVDINNLDDERGSWNIKFNFFKTGSSNIENTNTPSGWLYPHTTETLTGTGKIITKELYDTLYSCSYSISNEPTKQVCKDVTKYKEVTKTRTITRYRTEQKCE